MIDLTPQPGDLDPIETAPVDELRALQLERLQLVAAPRLRPRRRTTGRPSTRPASTRTTCRSLADLARFPFTTKADLRDNYPFGMFAVPREQVVADPRLERHDRPADRRRLHPRRHRHVGRRDGPLDPRRRRAAGRHRRTSPTATACSPAASARTTAPSGSAARSSRSSGGMTERQVQLIRDFEPDIIMVTPSYMLAILDEMERAGRRPAVDRR